MKMLNAKTVQDQITALLLSYPELQEDDTLRADMIEGETSAHEFLSMIMRKIEETTSLERGTCEYLKHLQDRVARLCRREEAWRSLIFKIMNTADIKKVELPEATLSIHAGTPKVQITDEQLIPREFQRIKVEPDKIRIKAALQAHEMVPGAVLSNAEPTLAIKVK